MPAFAASATAATAASPAPPASVHYRLYQHQQQLWRTFRLDSRPQDRLRRLRSTAAAAAQSGGAATPPDAAEAAAERREKEVREVPGSYGPPILGVAADRLKYFVTEGRDEFFLNLMRRYKSSVVRVNMPPGPPLFPDSRTIMLLDQKSIRVLFDNSKVEKRDVFAGTYMPSTEFTGGFRLLPYLDPSEPKHSLLKSFCSDILKENARRWLPEFAAAFSDASSQWDHDISAGGGGADAAASSQRMILSFLLRSVIAADPASVAALNSDAPALIQAWIAAQLAPQTNLGLPPPLDYLLHLFPLPFHLVSQPYDKLYRFFRRHSAPLLDLAHHRYGLDRDEACHNLLFFLCFNTWGGFLLFIPSLLRRIDAAGLALQRRLAAEVREAVGEDGVITMKALQEMELVKATVYEVLRIEPPVPFLYGRAKEDMVVESQEAAFKVRKGELLGGYQKIAMRDPTVFESPDSFLPERFMGEDGKKLLECLTWSNGPETEQPSLQNKQCPGKDFVNVVARLFVAHLFLRYDFFKLTATDDASSSTDANAPLKFAALKKRRK